MNKFLTSTRLYSIFVFFLVITSNYLGELFPCKVQNILTENVYMKHFFGYLTLLFFVVISDTSSDIELSDTVLISLGLYGIFLILINTDIHFFLICMVILGASYLINLHKQYKEENGLILESWIDNTISALYISFGVFLLIGFIIYMGEKKIEYKKNFNYITFIFGKSKCKNETPETNLLRNFKAAFS
jgi:hypothetical protein